MYKLLLKRFKRSGLTTHKFEVINDKTTADYIGCGFVFDKAGTKEEIESLKQEIIKKANEELHLEAYPYVNGMICLGEGTYAEMQETLDYFYATTLLVALDILPRDDKT
ncbi:MAG: hypothetical protein LLG05_14115 [Porphyromonadaceae bacterium]|nr:hypothetical protein [Porphyromonadaceae bacterium]